MQVTNNPDAFSAAADELAIRLIRIIALCLHKSPDVAFDLTDPEAVDSELFFDLCFKSAAAFEEQSGIDVDGVRYTPKVVFEANRFGPEEHVIIDGGSVHAKIDDSQTIEGFARALASIDAKPKADPKTG
jgi:hypothetical protein